MQVFFGGNKSRSKKKKLICDILFPLVKTRFFGYLAHVASYFICIVALRSLPVSRAGRTARDTGVLRLRHDCRHIIAFCWSYCFVLFFSASGVLKLACCSAFWSACVYTIQIWKQLIKDKQRTRRQVAEKVKAITAKKCRIIKPLKDFWIISHGMNLICTANVHELQFCSKKTKQKQTNNVMSATTPWLTRDHNTNNL